MTSHSLRHARTADAATLADLRREAILTLAAPIMGAERARSWADSAAEDRVRRAIDHHEVWVAECEGAVVGWIEIDRDRVEALYVRPAAACCGIGSSLLLRAEGLLRAAGYTHARLEASANAERFYLRRGFELQPTVLASGGRAMVKPL